MKEQDAEEGHPFFGLNGESGTRILSAAEEALSTNSSQCISIAIASFNYINHLFQVLNQKFFARHEKFSCKRPNE